MQLATAKVSLRLWGLGATIGAALLMSISHLVNSDSNKSRVFVPKNHETGHVHDHGHQTWPPHLEKITNIVDFSKVGEGDKSRAKKTKHFDELERSNDRHAEFKNALGKKFSRIEFSDNEDKYNSVQSSKSVYFSRDRNATVEVVSEGTQIKEVKSMPAGEYQPEITDEEIAEATRLAKQYFLDKGIARANDLKGYGILAYSPEGRGFYPHRIIYISLHADLDAPPQLMAWVDLTNGTIFKSREEK